jgi:hypothetical protein
MTCAVASAAHGTMRTVSGSGAAACPNRPARQIVVIVGELAGDRRGEDALGQAHAVVVRNLSAGMILPRALPVMSGTRHSTSVICRSFSQRSRGFPAVRGPYLALARWVMVQRVLLRSAWRRHASPNARKIAR